MRLFGLGFFTKTLLALYASYTEQAYFSLMLYLILALLLCGLLATLSFLFSLSSSQDTEKKSEYECGFEPFDSATRLPFDVHFYLVGILFLIFDVEVALLFPWVFSLRTCGWFGFYLVVGFIVLLSVGFLYEWKRGALIWPSRQKELAFTNGPLPILQVPFHETLSVNGSRVYLDLVMRSDAVITNANIKILLAPTGEDASALLDEGQAASIKLIKLAESQFPDTGLPSEATELADFRSKLPCLGDDLRTGLFGLPRTLGPNPEGSSKSGVFFPGPRARPGHELTDDDFISGMRRVIDLARAYSFSGSASPDIPKILTKLSAAYEDYPDSDYAADTYFYMLDQVQNALTLNKPLTPVERGLATALTKKCMELNWNLPRDFMTKNNLALLLRFLKQDPDNPAVQPLGTWVTLHGICGITETDSDRVSETPRMPIRVCARNGEFYFGHSDFPIRPTPRGTVPHLILHESLNTAIRFDPRVPTPACKGRAPFYHNSAAPRPAKGDAAHATFELFRALSYGVYIFLFEITIALTLVYYVITIAEKIGAAHSKRLIALETLNASCLLLIVLCSFLVKKLYRAFVVYLCGGYLATTPGIICLQVLLTLAVLFVLEVSRLYVKTHKKELLEYPLVIVFAYFFMILMLDANDLVCGFFSLIGFSLNIYVLVLFDAPESVAREAGVKYYYLSTFSSGLMLYGIFLVFVVLRTAHYAEIGAALYSFKNIYLNYTFPLVSGIALFFVGVFFKLSAFPGHLWAADVYEGSSGVVVAFFMLPVKVAVLSFLINVTTGALYAIGDVWQPLVIFATIGSLFWGAFAAVFERKTRRFLAYAAINQIGFVLTGLTTNSYWGTFSCLLYLLLYTIMSMGFLSVYIGLWVKNKNITYLTGLRGLSEVNWLYSWGLAILLLSMAGTPPLAGFFGKYYLLLSLQREGLSFIVVSGLFVSLLSAYYYLRVIKIFWFENVAGACLIHFHATLPQKTIFFAAESFLWVFIIISSFALPSIDRFMDILTGTFYLILT